MSIRIDSRTYVIDAPEGTYTLALRNAIAAEQERAKKLERAIRRLMEYTMRDCAFAGATLVSETYTDCAQKGILGSGMCQYCEARAALLGAT